MNKFRFTLNVLAVAIFTVAFAAVAQAQASRTWVSGVGDDANPCSRTAPCKTFAGAISKTANGGEIDALDPGGYGALTITKAITIDGGGGQVASVLVSGTNGIVVQANPATDTVILRNLRFNGIGTGINGIRFLAGKALNVENDYIFGFTTNGVDIALNQSQNASVFVKDSVMKNCGGDGIAAINASTGLLKVTIERSSFVECNNGIHARQNATITARNCDVSMNTNDGVFADSNASGAANTATIRIWASMISNNGSFGVLAGNGGNAGLSVVEIAQNQINNNAGNGVFLSSGGTIETFVNNSIRGNGTDGCAGCTPVNPGN
jgi:hypothetical protein